MHAVSHFVVYSSRLNISRHLHDEANDDWSKKQIAIEYESQPFDLREKQPTRNSSVVRSDEQQINDACTQSESHHTYNQTEHISEKHTCTITDVKASWS